MVFTCRYDAWRVESLRCPYPLLFYGWRVEHGSTSREVHITDIAPTDSSLSPQSAPAKILRDGQLLILLPDGKLFDTTGKRLR